MIDNNLHNVWDAYLIDYTYIHTDNESTSIIDHLLVNSMIYYIYVAGEVYHQYSDGYSIVQCICVLMLTIYLFQCIMMKYLIPNWLGTKLIRTISTHINRQLQSQ